MGFSSRVFLDDSLALADLLARAELELRLQKFRGSSNELFESVSSVSSCLSDAGLGCVICPEKFCASMSAQEKLGQWHSSCCFRMHKALQVLHRLV